MSDPTAAPDRPSSTTVADAPVAAERRVTAHPRPPRAGELSLGWRAITAGAWIGVVIGLAAVWNASVQLGLSTWWLGARADPQPTYVRFAPFVAPVLMLLATINHVRRLAWWGLGASAVLAAVAAGDLGRVASLARIEFAIAGAAALVSIASFTGTYRLADDEPGPTDSAAAS